MADITMCINEFCPKKKECYRYTATPEELHQWYGDFDYHYDSKGNVVCKDYMPNPPKSNEYEKL